MAFEDGTTLLNCKACGAIHMARWSQMPVREKQTIRCCGCNGIISQGTSIRDYFEINLVGPSADLGRTGKGNTHG